MKAVIFDIGQVLIRLDFTKVFSIPEAKKDLQSWEFYDRFERGKLSKEEFSRTISSRFQLSDGEFLEFWNSILRETIPGIDPLLSSLKEKCPIFALTNSNVIHMEYAYANYPVLSHFEKVFTSFELGARKPESEIYTEVQDTLQLKPQDILFFDDRLENVEGAREVGWSAHQVSDSPTDLIQVLSKHF